MIGNTCLINKNGYSFNFRPAWCVCIMPDIDVFKFCSILQGFCCKFLCTTSFPWTLFINI